MRRCIPFLNDFDNVPPLGSLLQQKIIERSLLDFYDPSQCDEWLKHEPISMKQVCSGFYKGKKIQQFEIETYCQGLEIERASYSENDYNDLLELKTLDFDIKLQAALRKVNLFGIEGYGLLNCPNYKKALQALAVTLSDGSSLCSWQSKAKAKDKNIGVAAIAEDVIALYKSIEGRNTKVGYSDDFVLLVSEQDYSYLQHTNGDNISCLDKIKLNLNNLEVKVVQELDSYKGNEGRKIILYPKKIDGQDVGSFAFVDNIKFYAPFSKQPYKGLFHSCTVSTFGAVIKHPEAFGVMFVS